MYHTIARQLGTSEPLQYRTRIGDVDLLVDLVLSGDFDHHSPSPVRIPRVHTRAPGCTDRLSRRAPGANLQRAGDVPHRRDRYIDRSPGPSPRDRRRRSVPGCPPRRLGVWRGLRIVQYVVDQFCFDGSREHEPIPVIAPSSDPLGERPSVHDHCIRVEDDRGHQPRSSSSDATRRKSACSISMMALASRYVSSPASTPSHTASTSSTTPSP